MLTNVGGGGAPAAAGAAPAAAAAGGAAAEAAPAEEKKEEAKEESDDDMVGRRCYSCSRDRRCRRSAGDCRRPHNCDALLDRANQSLQGFGLFD
jgi:hypothetical protein